MARFEVTTEWSGYSRGRSTYIVEAESEEDARDIYWEDDPVKRNVVRDDTEQEVIKVKRVVDIATPLKNSE